MTVPSADRWTAFLLSLTVPGAGQLFVGRWSCIAWFVAAALGVPLAAMAGGVAGWVLPALLALASAEHAKRCLEPTARGCGGTSRVRCASRGRAVQMCIEVDIAAPATAVWSVVRDFARFICVDPFHTQVVVHGPELQPGVDLAIEHRAFFVSLWRFGRLLTWREGHGYAFSEFSAKGPHHGFPHVFFFDVQSRAADRTCLRVDIRGKWTMRWLPLWVARWWLFYVCCEHARLLRGLFAEEIA